MLFFAFTNDYRVSIWRKKDMGKKLAAKKNSFCSFEFVFFAFLKDMENGLSWVSSDRVAIAPYVCVRV